MALETIFLALVSLLSEMSRFGGPHMWAVHSTASTPRNRPARHNTRIGQEGNPDVSTPDPAESPSEQASEQRSRTADPVVGEDAKARAREMTKAYEDRPTAVLPGSGNTVTGTAVNEWLDEEGRPIYGRDDNAGNSS